MMLAAGASLHARAAPSVHGGPTSVFRSAGTVYAFGVYSDQIKDNLNYTQHEIQSVGSAANIGCGGGRWVAAIRLTRACGRLYAALFGGLVYDAFGPAPTMAGGILLVFAGYLLVYLAATETIMHPPWLVRRAALRACPSQLTPHPHHHHHHHHHCRQPPSPRGPRSIRQSCGAA